MIQTCSEVDNKISSDQTGLQNSKIMKTLNPNDIPSIFRIVFGRNLWRIQLLNNTCFLCEFIEMFLRPLPFNVRIKHTRRHEHILSATCSDSPHYSGIDEGLSRVKISSL